MDVQLDPSPHFLFQRYMAELELSIGDHLEKVLALKGKLVEPSNCSDHLTLSTPVTFNPSIPNISQTDTQHPAGVPSNYS